MNNKAKKLSLSGVLLAITVVTLFIESIAPTNKISLYVLSSFFVSIVITEFGLGSGWLFYVSSCLLAFIIVQDKMALIPYVIFFGIYGIFKFHIEGLNKLILEYIIKIAYFNIILFSLYFFLKQVFLQDIDMKLPLWSIFVLAQPVFLIYDYVFSLFIQYYRNKIKNMIKL